MRIPIVELNTKHTRIEPIKVTYKTQEKLSVIKSS
jgi:hypothetical protein